MNIKAIAVTSRGLRKPVTIIQETMKDWYLVKFQNGRKLEYHIRNLISK